MNQASHTVLATDLDGTFLGGNDFERAALYDVLRKHRDVFTLVFVTGRDLPFIRSIVESGLVPRPDAIIGDVGTSVVDQDFDHIAAVQDSIDRRWENASARVIEMLKDEPGIKLQPGDWSVRRRVSYYYEPAELQQSTLDKVENAGFDWILSANIYFDVMPKGISKGPTLRRLVEHRGWDPDRVLAAGDTLNDVTLLAEGFPAVAVGNSEPALLDRVRELDSVYRARGHGAAGILEALRHFELGQV